MASVAVTNITNVTRLVAGQKGTQLSLGGLPCEVFRIASGQAPGDTAVLTPSNINGIGSVFGPVQHNIGTATVSAVTVTITGNGATTTVAAVDVYLVGPVNQS